MLQIATRFTVVLPALSFLWALWSLYSNIKYVQEFVHRRWSQIVNLANYHFAHRLKAALKLFAAVSHALDEYLRVATEKFYAFLRPLAIVAAMIGRWADTVLRSLQRLQPLLRRSMAMVTPFATAIANAARALGAPLRSATLFFQTVARAALTAIEPLRNLLLSMRSSIAAVGGHLWSVCAGLRGAATELMALASRVGGQAAMAIRGCFNLLWHCANTLAAPLVHIARRAQELARIRTVTEPLDKVQTLLLYSTPKKAYDAYKAIGLNWRRTREMARRRMAVSAKRVLASIKLGRGRRADGTTSAPPVQPARGHASHREPGAVDEEARLRRRGMGLQQEFESHS
jgi:hypothetical protein